MQRGKAKIYTLSTMTFMLLLSAPAAMATVSGGNEDQPSNPALQDPAAVQEAQAQIQLQSRGTPDAKNPTTPPAQDDSSLAPATVLPDPTEPEHAQEQAEPPKPKSKSKPKKIEPVPPRRNRSFGVPQSEDDGDGSTGLLFFSPSEEQSAAKPPQTTAAPAPPEASQPRPGSFPGIPGLPTIVSPSTGEEDDSGGLTIFGKKFLPGILSPPDKPLPAAAAPKSPPTQPVPTPPPRPKLSPDPDSKTAAGFCATCEADRLAKAKKLEKIPPEKIDRSSVNARAACYGRALLRVAKSRQSNYGRRYSGGRCAGAVGNFLAGAGFEAKRGSYRGDAADFWRRPRQSTGILEQMGYVNMKGTYNEYNAPPGAVLVFGGPLTESQYERTGSYPGPRERVERALPGPGTWVGHITVKGDQPKHYYTDGDTSEPAIGGRHLVGVFVMMNSCKTCSDSLKRQCEK